MFTRTEKFARLSRDPRDTKGVNWSPSDRTKSAPAVSLCLYRDSILLRYGNLVNKNNSENFRQQSLDTTDNLYRADNFIIALLR